PRSASSPGPAAPLAAGSTPGPRGGRWPRCPATGRRSCGSARPGRRSCTPSTSLSLLDVAGLRLRLVDPARALPDEARRRGLDLVLHVDLERGDLEGPLRPGEHVVDRLVVLGAGLAVDAHARHPPAAQEDAPGLRRPLAGALQDQDAALALHLEDDEQRRQ